jgi:hypothetical protein
MVDRLDQQPEGTGDESDVGAVSGNRQVRGQELDRRQRVDGRRIASIVTLLIGATSVVSALETLLEQVWRSEALAPVGVWGWIRTRTLSLAFICRHAASPGRPWPPAAS